MPVITSRRHPIVAEVRAAARGDDGRMLLDGWHLVADAANAGLRLDVVAVSGTTTADESALLARLDNHGCRIVEVTPRVMDALSPVRTPSGVIALASRPSSAVEALLDPAPALVVVAVGVQDPGNVGAIIRAAEAGGATGALLDATSADPFGWKALRAAMGSSLRLPIGREADVTARLSAWRAAGLTILSTDARHGADLYDTSLTGPCAVVMGAEGGGVPPSLHEAADARIRIPLRAPVESLNVAVAAALIVYEARRQRGRAR